MKLVKLSRQQLNLLGIAACFAIGGGLYFFVFQPLLHQLKIHSAECSRIEREASALRPHVSAFQNQPIEKRLITEKEVTSALNELTRRGNLKGVEFVLLKPQAVEKLEGKPSRILPIETEVRSTYQELAGFLGAMDKLERSLVTVESFTATQGTENISKIRTRLKIQMHLEN